MAYGLQTFAADGSEILSVDTVAYLSVDSFVIDRVSNPNGVKSYPGVDPRGFLHANLTQTRYMTLRTGTPIGRYKDAGGYFLISVNQSTKEVSWRWVPPEITGGGSFDQAIVSVFIGDGV